MIFYNKKDSVCDNKGHFKFIRQLTQLDLIFNYLDSAFSANITLPLLDLTKPNLTLHNQANRAKPYNSKPKLTT